MSTAPDTSLPDATRLAVERTRLAHDRTLMAWVRTATSLISFGFTIYKFFQYMRENQQVPSEGLLGPRGFALVMIVIGLGTLTVATIQHRQSLQALRRQYGGLVGYSLATVTAGLIALLGIFALYLTALRR
jgi:putative membrane protein